jgi:light-regulated signal transduction histidine kinase (bacteriophytochrome)
VRKSAQRMGELIDDLLALSRVGKAEVKRARVDLSLEANKVASELKGAHPARALEFAIAPNLVVDADAGLVRVLLENLLGNAVKFTAPTPRARIEVGSQDTVGDVTYFVRDNGVGFKMSSASKLFGAFQRLHAQQEFEGTGIGLATVLRVVKRHGGRVWAEAAPGLGATFFFTLTQAGGVS